MLSFHTEMIPALFPLGNVLLRELQTDEKKSIFRIFESALYLKSLSMPLTNIIVSNEIAMNKPNSISYSHIQLQFKGGENPKWKFSKFCALSQNSQYFF